MEKRNRPTFDMENSSLQKQAAEKAQRELTLVEAALYVSGRPLTLKELCSVLKTRSKRRVLKLAKTITDEYARRNTALEILHLKDDRYVLQLKAKFTSNVRNLVKKPLLSPGPLKTLAYISYRQPVSQKRVVDVRGQHVYSHMRLLKEAGLVVGERKGRSTILRTTEHFADYFGLSHDQSAMKRQLKKVFQNELTVEKGAKPLRQYG